MINATCNVQALGGGRKSFGYFASDLTLKQIKSLNAKQSFAERDQSVNKKYRWDAPLLMRTTIRNASDLS